MIQIIFFMLAAACYAVMSHLRFHNTQDGKFRRHTFFGAESWRRKYRKGVLSTPGNYDLLEALDSPYYDIFKIKYREKFPWSATALVFLTDGYHLFQWLMIKFLLLGFTVNYNHGFHFDWVGFILLWASWTVIFNFVYTGLKK